MQTKEYDINIYVIDNIVKVLCYEMKTDDKGIFVSTVTEKDPIRLEIPIDTTNVHLQEILGFLLDKEDYWDVPHEFLDAGYDWMEWWEEHDEWTGMDALLSDSAPKLLRDWAKALPTYHAEIFTPHDSLV